MSDGNEERETPEETGGGKEAAQLTPEKRAKAEKAYGEYRKKDILSKTILREVPGKGFQPAPVRSVLRESQKIDEVPIQIPKTGGIPNRKPRQLPDQPFEPDIIKQVPKGRVR